eukprot:TRINITY_DN3518_c0_g1_i4.p1 TRINITY_DN3518_c0_g1~~TRINITY_DN3518_c0_g1_i4.p1  ORF type:complete len:768 (+),score=-5.81 TRINITY_DN3518_c0_g1_i4:100-2304(+)
MSAPVDGSPVSTQRDSLMDGLSSLPFDLDTCTSPLDVPCDDLDDVDALFFTPLGGSAIPSASTSSSVPRQQHPIRRRGRPRASHTALDRLLQGDLPSRARSQISRSDANDGGTKRPWSGALVDYLLAPAASRGPKRRGSIGCAEGFLPINVQLAVTDSLVPALRPVPVTVSTIPAPVCESHGKSSGKASEKRASNERSVQVLPSLLPPSLLRASKGGLPLTALQVAQATFRASGPSLASPASNPKPTTPAAKSPPTPVPSKSPKGSPSPKVAPKSKPLNASAAAAVKPASTPSTPAAAAVADSAVPAETSADASQCSDPSTVRRCLHCSVTKTPQWRAGPLGPKTLCNACGVRFKSGRLCAEYRPANSPEFVSHVHSNSHRKIVEMRRKCGDTSPLPAVRERGEGRAAAASPETGAVGMGARGADSGEKRRRKKKVMDGDAPEGADTSVEKAPKVLGEKTVRRRKPKTEAQEKANGGGGLESPSGSEQLPPASVPSIQDDWLFGENMAGAPGAVEDCFDGVFLPDAPAGEFHSLQGDGHDVAMGSFGGEMGAGLPVLLPWKADGVLLTMDTPLLPAEAQLLSETNLLGGGVVVPWGVEAETIGQGKVDAIEEAVAEGPFLEVTTHGAVDTPNVAPSLALQTPEQCSAFASIKTDVSTPVAGSVMVPITASVSDTLVATVTSAAATTVGLAASDTKPVFDGCVGGVAACQPPLPASHGSCARAACVSSPFVAASA